MIKAVKDNRTKNNWSIEVDEKEVEAVALKTNIRVKAFYKNHNDMYCTLISESAFRDLLAPTFASNIRGKLTKPKDFDIEDYISESLTYAYNRKWIELDNMLAEKKDNIDSDSNTLYMQYARFKIKENYNIEEKDISLYFEQSGNFETLLERLSKLEDKAELTNVNIIVESISDYLQMKYGKGIEVDRKQIIDNLDDLREIEIIHFKLNGYYLSAGLINDLQEKYNMQGKYQELIKLLDRESIHSSIKKEFLTQTFLRKVSEKVAVFLFITNEYTQLSDVGNVFDNYDTELQFTEFELALIDSMLKFQKDEMLNAQNKLLALDSIDEKIKYLNEVKLKNKIIELSQIEKDLMSKYYKLSTDEVDSVQNSIILTSQQPTIEVIEHCIEQLNLNNKQFIYDINKEVKQLLLNQNKYTDKDLTMIQGQLIFNQMEATVENIEIVAKELHIEDVNIMKHISKLLDDNRAEVNSKSIDERVNELLSENTLKSDKILQLETELQELIQKEELQKELSEIINEKNQFKIELEEYNKELESKEKDVLKEIANRLCTKFDIERQGNFDELLDEIINQLKCEENEDIYIAKKKFAIFEGQFIKSNLNRLPEQSLIEVFEQINVQCYSIIPKEDRSEYIVKIK